jgi:hypothetical protein
MVAFEEKVISFQRQNDSFQNKIVRGSDEHLDQLLTFQKRLMNLTAQYAEFLNGIIPESNTLTDDQVAKNAIPSLLDLYSSSIRLVATLKRRQIGSDLKNSCQAYYAQVDNLRELIADLENHRVNDDGLNEILEELNLL